jgi:hypothetical protein
MSLRPIPTTAHAIPWHWANVHYQGGSAAQVRAHEKVKANVKAEQVVKKP